MSIQLGINKTFRRWHNVRKPTLIQGRCSNDIVYNVCSTPIQPIISTLNRCQEIYIDSTLHLVADVVMWFQPSFHIDSTSGTHWADLTPLPICGYNLQRLVWNGCTDCDYTCQYPRVWKKWKLWEARGREPFSVWPQAGRHLDATAGHVQQVCILLHFLE